MANPGKQSLEAVQVLRGFAVIAVILHHAADRIEALAPFQTGAKPFFIDRALNTDVGAVGVDVFFVISGFIMSYTAAQSEAWSFLKRRIVRIYPLYWICGLIVLGLRLTPWIRGLDEDLPTYVKSVLLYPTLIAGQVRPALLPQGWTLIYEMLFYLLFALTIAQPRRWQMLSIAVLLAGGVALGSAWPWAGGAAIAVFLREPIVFEFVAGMLLGFLVTETTIRLSRALCWLALLAAAVTLLPSAFLPGYDWSVPRLIKFGIPAFLLVGAAVLYRKSEAIRFPRALLLVGDASYSLYLTHTIVLLLCSTAYARIGFLGQLPYDLYYALLCGAVLWFGVWFYLAVEVKVLRACKPLVRSRRAPVAKTPGGVVVAS